MPAPRGPAATEGHLDDLRRRLYRADATEEDVRRYLAQQPSVEPVPAVAPAPPRRRRRLAVGLAVAVVGGVLLTAGVRLVQPEATPPAPKPSVTASAPASAQDDDRRDDGGPLAFDARSVLGPTPVPASIAGTDVIGQRFQGYGDAVVLVDPPPDAFQGGSATVAVTSAEPASVTWRALILVTRQDWTSFPVLAAQGPAEERTGAHTPTTFVYPNRPPTRIAIDAPSGVGWTLVVGLTGEIAADTPVVHVAHGGRVSP